LHCIYDSANANRSSSSGSDRKPWRAAPADNAGTPWSAACPAGPTPPSAGLLHWHSRPCTASCGLNGCRSSQRSATLPAPVDRCGTLAARASGVAVRAALPPAWSACGQQRAASDHRAQAQRLTPGATGDSKYIIPRYRLAPPELCQHLNNVWECPGCHSTARGSHGRVRRCSPGRTRAAAHVVFGAAAPAQRVQPVRLAGQWREVAPLICHIAAEAPLDGLLQHDCTCIATLIQTV